MTMTAESGLQSKHHQCRQQVDTDTADDDDGVPLATLADIDEEPRSPEQSSKNNKPASACHGQKGAIIIITTALLFAVVLFSVTVSYSVKKPKQIHNQHHEQIEIAIEPFNKGGDAATDATSEVELSNIVVEDDYFMVESGDESESDTSSIDSSLAAKEESDTSGESQYYSSNDAVIPIIQENNIRPNKNDGQEVVVPDNNIIIVSNESESNNNTTTKLIPEEDEEEDGEEPPSLYTGDISDFVDMTNITRVISTSSNRCSATQGECRIDILTDKYPWEMSWKIVRVKNSREFGSGPPTGRNYARRTRYIGSFCLPQGRYYLQMDDTIGDGICCSHGEGSVNLRVNGNKVVQTGNENYKVKKYFFRVNPSSDEASSPGNSGNDNSNNNDVPPAINKGKECAVVTPIDYNTKFQHGTKYEGFPGGYECYRSVEGTRRTVNDLLVQYPQLTSKAILPYPTAALGKRLNALVITNKQANANNGKKGKLLAISSIHAAEIMTSETMIRFSEYLLQNYGVDPEVTWILDYTEIHLILQANPDGRVYLEEYTEETGETKIWRKNRNQGNCDQERFGVDPNRNFPFKWGQCDATDGSRCTSSSNCGTNTYMGPNEGSEQETKAIVQYAAALFPASQRKGNVQQSEAGYNTAFPDSTTEGIFLDMHSHGGYVGWPWGFKNEKTPNDESLGALGRKLASFSGYSLWAPKMPNRLYSFPGSTIDTMHGWLGAASFFFELGTSFYQSCDTYPTVINEAFPALLYAAKVAKNPYTTPRGPDILCTTISSTRMSSGNLINVNVEVSDNARIIHEDDGGSLFSTGRQNVRSVEIFVNCHPYASNCQPTVKKNLTNAGRTATVSLQFQAPVGRNNHVMYIRAKDSSKQTGPITARNFVG